MFPRVPKESTRAPRVANLSGGNQRVISLRVPIRLQAIPAPRRILPATSVAVESPVAKTNAPAAPRSESAVMAIRGPMASRYMPMGICVRAKA